MTEIVLFANDEVLELVKNPTISSGDVNCVSLSVDFSQEWDGFTKVAVLFNGDFSIGNNYEKVLTNGKCTIPGEVLKNAEPFYIGIKGIKTDATKTSTILKYQVIKGVPTVITEITQDVYQQILTAYANLETIRNEVDADAKQTALDRAEVEKMVDSVAGIDEQVTKVEQLSKQAQESATQAGASAKVAEQAKTQAETAKAGAETAAGKTAEDRTAVDQARTAVEEAQRAVKADRTAVEEVKQSVEQLGNAIPEATQAGVQAVNQAKQTAVYEITRTGTSHKEAVEAAGTTAVQNVSNSKADALQAVETAKTEVVQAVQTEGTKQSGNVTAEGAKQVKAVADKGAEVLKSIPPDFTTQMENKLDKQQGIENAGKAIVVGSDGSLTVGDVQSSGGANGAIGEILIADYTHQGNAEFHFTSFDYTTGIGTTAAPHGLTQKTEVLMCPNGWTDFAPFENMMAMPIEWTMTTNNPDSALALIPVDSIHLKVVASKTDSIINVDMEDVSNKSVDITKMHFEAPVAFSIRNLDSKINTRYIKVISNGYCHYTAKYRYRNISVLFKDGSVGNVKYLNTTGFNRAGNSPSKNGVFLNEETFIDLRNNTKYYNKAVSYARRKGYSSLVNDVDVKAFDTWLLKQKGYIEAIQSYSTYSQEYAYMANGTRIQIYAMEGAYKK